MAEAKVLKIEQAKPDYLMCKKCSNHITRRDELQFIYPMEQIRGEPKLVGAVNALINVRVDKSAKYRVYGSILSADVFCFQCDKYLGMKLVDINGGTQQLTAGGKVYTLRNRMVMLLMEQLLWTDGEKTKPGIDVILC